MSSNLSKNEELTKDEVLERIIRLEDEVNELRNQLTVIKNLKTSEILG